MTELVQWWLCKKSLVSPRVGGQLSWWVSGRWISEWVSRWSVGRWVGGGPAGGSGVSGRWVGGRLSVVGGSV